MDTSPLLCCLQEVFHRALSRMVHKAGFWSLVLVGMDLLGRANHCYAPAVLPVVNACPCLVCSHRICRWLPDMAVEQLLSCASHQHATKHPAGQAMQPLWKDCAALQMGVFHAATICMHMGSPDSMHKALMAPQDLMHAPAEALRPHIWACLRVGAGRHGGRHHLVRPHEHGCSRLPGCCCRCARLHPGFGSRHHPHRGRL